MKMIPFFTNRTNNALQGYNEHCHSIFSRKIVKNKIIKICLCNILWGRRHGLVGYIQKLNFKKIEIQFH